MAISPPLIPDHEPFNQLANRLARELATAFGYSLSEAEEHIRNFYLDCERSFLRLQQEFKEARIQSEPMTPEEVFWHDDSALVLLIGYRVAGGDTNGIAFLDWRKNCWEPLSRGERVPAPPV